MTAEAAAIYRRVFGAPPDGVAQAPGRVNLIGEHTDYNAGLVLPLALEQTTAVAFGARADPLLHFVAADFDDQTARLELAAPPPGKGWQNYVRGVGCELRAHLRRELRGANLVIKTALPIGAGLSSSAALELAVLRLSLIHI